VILAGEGPIRLEHLPPSLGSGNSAAKLTAGPVGANLLPDATADKNELRVPVGSTIEQTERALIELTLEHTKNNKTRAAEILGISQKTLFNKLREYGAAEVSSA
jgi:DNA-binding NtrC family response regulator